MAILSIEDKKKDNPSLDLTGLPDGYEIFLWLVSLKSKQGNCGLPVADLHQLDYKTKESDRGAILLFVFGAEGGAAICLYLCSEEAWVWNCFSLPIL